MTCLVIADLHYNRKLVRLPVDGNVGRLFPPCCLTKMYGRARGSKLIDEVARMALAQTSGSLLPYILARCRAVGITMITVMFKRTR